MIKRMQQHQAEREAQAANDANNATGDDDAPAENSKNDFSYFQNASDDDDSVGSLVESHRRVFANEDSDSDSDNEKPPTLTIGNVPIEWYDDLPHLGYDLDGNPIMKPKTQDELDRLLNREDDPNYSRTITDEVTGESIRVTDRELEIIQRIRAGKPADPSYNEEDDEPIYFFSRETSIHPLSSAPPRKANFIPSKWEKQKVIQLVRLIRQGHIKATKPKPKSFSETYNFDVWDADTDSKKSKLLASAVPAPKLKLPGHEESYNPPVEYLWTEHEKRSWAGLDKTNRPHVVVPEKFSSLREVPAYRNFIREQFDRCLDLYMCPRVERKKLNIGDPEKLIPKLPSPDELRPFPTKLSMLFLGHSRRIRSISCSPDGQYLCSGSDDHTVRVWEVATGRCVCALDVRYDAPDCKQTDYIVEQVCFNPNPAVPLIAVLTENKVLLYCPDLGAKEDCDRVKALFTITNKSVLKTSKGTQLCEWIVPTEKAQALGIVQEVHMFQSVKRFAWHKRGDYFATVCPRGESSAVMVHHLSRRLSQKPFNKTMGHVECVSFHPSRPLFFVAATRHVHIFNLMEQKLIKRLSTGIKMISSLSVHPGGDNVIVGGYDRRIAWFDLDMKPRPYKLLKFHKQAVRSVHFHPRYPLFASASDDATVHVFHGMVYSDLNKDPLIVPLKILRGHDALHSLGALDCEFHPTQPWVFSSGADHTIRLFISP